MTAECPFVSVVIPMRNEGESIRRCLDSVLGQDYPRERLEVIVVDGESDDDSKAIVEEYVKRDSRVRILTNTERVVPTAMNIGIRGACGDVIARVDAHTVLYPDYLRMGVETLRRTGADNVGGLISPVGGGGVGDAVAAAMSSRFGIGARFHFAEREQEADTVYMGMWPRESFVRFGLFDEELVRNQDDELNYRIRKGGGCVWLTPAMRSAYQNRSTIKQLARQFFQYGEWKVRILQKHPLQMSWRHFVPPSLVLVLGLSLLLFWVVPGIRMSAGFVAGTYVGAVLIASGCQKSVRTVRRWLTTALVFVVIHLAWGSGFLFGLLRFAKRWGSEEPWPPKLDSKNCRPG